MQEQTIEIKSSIATLIYVWISVENIMKFGFYWLNQSYNSFNTFPFYDLMWNGAFNCLCMRNILIVFLQWILLNSVSDVLIQWRIYWF